VTAPAPPPAPVAWTSFDAWADRLGAYAWFDQRLFELLGGWAARAPEVEVCLLLERQARRRAWHAELWNDLLPTVADRPAEDRVRPPSAEVAALLDALTPDETSPRASACLLVAVDRVVGPALADVQRAHLAAASPVAEAPTSRALDLVLADVAVDLAAGADLAEALIGADGVAAAEGRIGERWRAAVPAAW
jgi:hypothetical protein